MARSVWRRPRHYRAHDSDQSHRADRGWRDERKICGLCRLGARTARGLAASRACALFAGARTAHQPLPHLLGSWPIEKRCDPRASAARTHRHCGAYGAGQSRQPSRFPPERPAVAGLPARRVPHSGAGAGLRRGIHPADWLRECGESAAGADQRAAPRNGRAHGAGRIVFAVVSTIDCGKPVARGVGRRIGCSRGGGRRGRAAATLDVECVALLGRRNRRAGAGGFRPLGRAHCRDLRSGACARRRARGYPRKFEPSGQEWDASGP